MLIDLYADENIDQRLVSFLRASGYAVKYGREIQKGRSDQELLAEAFAQLSILLTEDKDFGEWVFAHKRPTIGIILLRYRPSEKERIRLLLLNLLNARGPEILASLSY
ncbi:MAG: DUF5615 family PIN-like protein [Spirochaetales bacterium]|nr:DUF5615 family PIN-like protein [Spirochaetales bacterium]